MRFDPPTAGRQSRRMSRPAKRRGGPDLRAAAVAALLAAAAIWSGAAGVGLNPAAAQTLDAPSDATAGAPALWRVVDDDSELWLFGSVHLLEADVQWRRPDLFDALDAADAVYFEAPTDLLSQIKVQKFIAENGFFTDGGSLFDVLSPSAAASLDDVVERLALDRALLASMRPWLAFTVVSTQLAMAGGATLENGVDAQMTVAAARARKELRSFETLEQQTRFFADMRLADQIAILEATVADFELQSQQLEKLVAAWASGDLARFEAVLFDEADALPPAFREILFTRRNAAWADELTAFLNGSGRALVVVGAGHFVGEDSVIAMLERDGWTVERR